MRSYKLTSAVKHYKTIVKLEYAQTLAIPGVHFSANVHSIDQHYLHCNSMEMAILKGAVKHIGHADASVVST